MNDQATIGVLDEFQTDLVAAWRRLPNKGFFFTLLVAWLVLFQFRGNSILGYVHTPSLFAWMLEAYNSPDKAAADDSIGDFIPFLVLGLFWWKRKELLALPLKVWLPGLLIVFAAMVLHILGYVLQQPQVSIVALFTGIYGLTGLAWGWQWLQKSFFPFFLFVFSVPLGNHSDLITTRLQLLVCWLVEVVSHHILGIDIIRRGSQLFSPSGSYQYEVVAACSGIRSLFSIFLVATIYGFVTFHSTWRRLLIMVSAFPFAVLGNLLRLLCIIIAAEIGGQKAGDYVHEGGPFGIISLLPYVPVIVGVLLLGHLLKEPDPRPAQHE
jgi:exosortase